MDTPTSPDAATVSPQFDVVQRAALRIMGRLDQATLDTQAQNLTAVYDAIDACGEDLRLYVTPAIPQLEGWEADEATTIEAHLREQISKAAGAVPRPAP